MIRDVEESHSRAPRPVLALVLTPLGRNTSSLPHFYWTVLFSELRAAGMTVHVFQPSRVILALRQRRLPIVNPLFVIALLRTRPTFILATEYGPHTLLALITARCLGSKGIIFKEHADPVKQSGWRSLYRRMVSKCAHGIVANTDAAREDVSRWYSDEGRVQRVDFLVPPLIEQLTRARIRVAVTGHRPRFLFVGRLVEVKNVEALLEAASRLKQENRRFSVCIAGSGPLATRLMETARALDVDDIVQFIGPVDYDAVGHAYEACDVFVMPSVREYRSMAVLEAMRFGMPIIDSVCDGNAVETVADGVNGRLFDPTDVEDLAHAMREFIVDPDQIRVMGARSKESMRHLTPSFAADSLQNVLVECYGSSKVGK